MSAIQNLIKAHKAMAITSDTHSLQDYLAAHKDKKTEAAEFTIVGLESKYVPPTAERQSEYRTRFFLANGETIGTFSNGARRFFQFYQQLMGYESDKPFVHIDIQGQIVVSVKKLALDGNRSTYEFEMIEKGSEVNGFTDYLPTQQNILQLADGSKVDTDTGEKIE
jgi:hypothetical protein